MSVTIVNGWIKEALGIYYPNLSFGPFAQGQPRWGVLHGTASGIGSTAENIANTWRVESANGTGNASTHLLIDKDGTMVQGLPFTVTAWGNSGAPDSPRASYLPTTNLNFFTISIEHVKWDTQRNSDILTPLQQLSSFQACKAISAFTGIPAKVVTVDDVSQGGWIRHADCDAKNRSFCPGPYPFAALSEFLRGETMGPHIQQTLTDIWGTTYKTGTGIYTEWSKQAVQGHFKGAPSSTEYPCHNPDTGVATVAQNFGSNTCLWNSGNPAWM